MCLLLVFFLLRIKVIISIAELLASFEVHVQNMRRQFFLLDFLKFDQIAFMIIDHIFRLDIVFVLVLVLVLILSNQPFFDPLHQFLVLLDIR